MLIMNTCIWTSSGFLLQGLDVKYKAKLLDVGCSMFVILTFNGQVIYVDYVLMQREWHNADVFMRVIEDIV